MAFMKKGHDGSWSLVCVGCLKEISNKHLISDFCDINLHAYSELYYPTIAYKPYNYNHIRLLHHHCISYEFYVKSGIFMNYQDNYFFYGITVIFI